MEWDTHDFQSRITEVIGSGIVTDISIKCAKCSTSVFVELLDRINKQKKPETGFTCFRFREIIGLEKVLDRHVAEKLIENCS